MPRIDNSNYEVIDFFGLEFDDADPGMTNPVDLCRYCWDDCSLPVRDLDVDHPSYDDDVCYCAECGIRLDADDD